MFLAENMQSFGVQHRTNNDGQQGENATSEWQQPDKTQENSEKSQKSIPIDDTETGDDEDYLMDHEDDSSG